MEPKYASSDTFSQYKRSVEGLPNIKSQKKRVLTNAKANQRNKSVKSNLRTALKKANTALAGDSGDNNKIVADAYSVIDKAAQKGVIHKKTAARKKAAIAKNSLD